MLTEPITLPMLHASHEEERADELRGILSDLTQVGGRMTRLANRATKDSATMATWRTLSMLQSFGPMRLGELAAFSQVAQPTMTKIVAGLVERDWVKRIADVDDHRAWQIAISTKGLRVLKAWRSELADALAPLFDDLNDTERAVIRHAIDLISPRLDQGYAATESIAGKVSD